MKIVVDQACEVDWAYYKVGRDGVDQAHEFEQTCEVGRVGEAPWQGLSQAQSQTRPCLLGPHLGQHSQVVYAVGHGQDQVGV